MNADLTIDTRDYILVYSDADGSLRRETSEGVNLPEELTVRHSTGKDSATKLPLKRTVVRCDKTIARDDGSTAIVSAYLVASVPSISEVTSAHVLAACQRVLSVLSAEATTGLDLKEEILVNGEQ